MIYRLIFIIIALIIETFLPDSRYHRYGTLFGRRRYNRMYNFFEDADIPTNDGLAGKIRASIRRRKALKKCEKFLSKNKYILTLKNKDVLLIFDSKNKTMSCVDNNVKGRATTVVWFEQLYAIAEQNDNIFERTFDNICTSFNESANYQGISTVLKDIFKVQETSPQPKRTPPKTKIIKEEEPIKLTPRELVLEKLNINDATEEELSNLPGITIIIAKKIIKYRDTHGDFKDKDEFYREMKIKPHFQEKLNDLIRVNKGKKSFKENKKNERIIDF